MTRYMKWLGLAAAVLLVVCCFSPWVIIEDRNIIVSGIDAVGTKFGKPGYLHFFFVFLFLVFTFIPRVWAKQWNLLIVALNLGWAVRNYFIITSCHAGDCPEKQWAIYLIVLASILMLISALFPDMKLPGKRAGEL